MIRNGSRSNDNVWANRMRAAKKLKELSSGRQRSTAGLVSSSQDGVHPRLEQTVRRHLDRCWSQPLHRPSVDSYRRLVDGSSLTNGQPFILDSGCGTGKSTLQLAAQHSEYWVIGVDRSQARLAKNGLQQSTLQRENCILVRADLATIWRLLLRDGHIPHKHYLYYPNPWPKPGHLQRRWHGHPVFPSLLALGGEIEMRCNWEIYALEFARAVSLATGETITAEAYKSEHGVTPFEAKYIERSQPLFSVLVPRQFTAAFRQAVCIDEPLQDCCK